MFQAKTRDFQSVYKRNATYQEKRIIRASVKGKERRESRLRNFDRHRNIDDDLNSTDDAKENKLVNNDRLQKLKQWKMTRELLKLSEMQKKAKEKPPFKCGIVHHKPFPVELSTLPTLRRSTRNTKLDDTKVKSFAPKEHAFKPPSNVVPVELVTDSNKKLEKSRAQKGRPFQRITQSNSINSMEKAGSKKQSIQPNKSESKQVKISNRFSFQPRRSTRLSNHVVPVTGKTIKKDESINNPNLPQIMESSFSPANENKSTSDDGPALSFIYPADLSPFISKARGNGKKTPSSITKTSSSIVAPTSAKGSGGLRKQIGVKFIEKILNNPEEIKMEESKYLSSKENSTPISCGKASRVQHFRDLYSETMERLSSECLKWDELLLAEDIPVDVQDSIRTTVGVTRLLMREKLAQFKGLVDECESCIDNSKTTGQQIITTSDLQGFWELVSIQINDVESKFSKLQVIKDNNWVEIHQTPIQIEERKLRTRNKITFKPKKPIEKKSGFKAFMLEQKKKLLAEKKEEQMPTVTSAFEVESEVAKTPSKLNTSVRSILKSGRRRKSSKMSITANTSIKEVNTPPMEMTPRKVTFKGEVIEGSHGMKARLTPHSNRLKGNTQNSSPMTESQPCTQIPNGDLICWDSPYQELASRRSPRLRTNK